MAQVTKREFRTINAAELRASDDGNSLTGYAAVFGSPSEDLGGFTETVDAHAFDRCLAANPDIRALFNHDTGSVLGRTKNGTLQLSVDSRGLKMTVALPDTTLGRDVRELVKRQDISGMSFGFMVNEDVWNFSKVDDKDVVTRVLMDCEVFEVSAVAFPAYPGTSVSARSLWPDGKPELVETRGVKPTAAPVAPTEADKAEARKFVARQRLSSLRRK
jgi:uncharacterized protein